MPIELVQKKTDAKWARVGGHCCCSVGFWHQSSNVVALEDWHVLYSRIGHAETTSIGCALEMRDYHQITSVAECWDQAAS